MIASTVGESKVANECVGRPVAEARKAGLLEVLSAYVGGFFFVPRLINTSTIG